MNGLYDRLDAELLASIASGVNRFSSLHNTSRAPIPFTSGGRYRAVDRRLQVLRRKGRIKYTRKAGWVLSDSAPQTASAYLSNTEYLGWRAHRDADPLK